MVIVNNGSHFWLLITCRSTVSQQVTYTLPAVSRHWCLICTSKSRDVILLRNEKNGSFRNHQLCKSEWTNRSNSSNKDFLKRVLEAVYLGDWELEKLFNIADKWNQTNLGKFHQPKKKWAKAIVAIESTVQGIFLKWLFSFLCIFRSNI